jgi:hypothetical protein
MRNFDLNKNNLTENGLSEKNHYFSSEKKKFLTSPKR